MRKTLATLLGCLVLALAGSAAAQAPAYPQKRVTIVVPFAVGGIADTFARVIGQKLQDLWGQPFVVENKPGAGGNIGADLVAKAPADGHTLVMGNIGSQAINQYLVKAMPYDTLKDFAPVAFVLEADGILVVNPGVKAASVKELVELAKREPLTFGSAGIGSTSHLAGELFNKLGSVKMTHVPYKGNAPAITDLLGGQTTMIFATMPTVLPQVKAGKLRALAVIGNARSAAAPELPTVAEAGLPGFDVINWIGLFAPAGTPPEIVAKWNAEVQKIMSTPEVQKRLETEGAKFVASSPQSFAAFQRAESEKWSKAIADAGIKAE
jgi:tripartite-type tricarboxylate transporter receptor subunit TctC